MNWNFQEVLTKDPSSAWGCDTSGNIPPYWVALRRTCRCTEFHRVRNANLRHPSAMCYNLIRTKITLHEDYVYLCYSYYEKYFKGICKWNQNTYFMFNSFIPKFAPFFLSQCEIMWQNQTDHWWQYSRAHSFSMLGN